MKKWDNVEDYIQSFASPVKELLEEMRAIILDAVPDSQEVISYNMPAYKMNKVLVYFAGYKKHIGFYPTAKPMVHFEKELKPFKTSKGAIQFPLDKKLPVELIQKITLFRKNEVNS